MRLEGESWLTYLGSSTAASLATLCSLWVTKLMLWLEVCLEVEAQLATSSDASQNAEFLTKPYPLSHCPESAVSFLSCLTTSMPFSLSPFLSCLRFPF